MATFVPRLLAVAALAISGYVHLHLASRYPYPGTITGTQLFYAQGLAALAIALALLVVDSRWTWLAAVGLGVSSFAAVMLYRYVDVGALGPLPNMYDATWQPSPDKLLSAVVEASIVLWWLLHVLLRRGQAPAGSRRPHSGSALLQR